MSAVAGLLLSAAVAAVMAPGALRAFREAGWRRTNYRGVEVAFPAGVVAVVATLLSLGPLAAAQAAFGWELLWAQPDFAVFFGASDDVRVEYDGLPVESLLVAGVLFAGVAFLGLLDDLFEGEPRGWRGHFGAVLGGGFSTGVLKAAGTLALATLALLPFGLPAGEYVLAVAVVVLATNLFNLLDLRPGRAVKAWVLLAVPLIATADAAQDALRLVGPWAGPLLVLGLFDLRERAMLGDTGSNVVGALAGMLLVTTLGTTGQLVALGVLLALTIFGEFRSITAAVDRFPPLRGLDSLGRRDA